MYGGDEPRASSPLSLGMTGPYRADRHAVLVSGIGIVRIVDELEQVARLAFEHFAKRRER